MADKLKVILDLIHQHPNQTRFNCPFCNRINSLAVHSVDGSIRYKCFGVDCKTHGINKQRLEIDDIYTRKNNMDISRNSVDNVFCLPSYFVSPLDRPEVLEYLRRNHVLKAYEAGLVQLRYDPKDNRIVYLVRDSDGNICNCTGRLLSKSISSKWRIYGNNKSPFVCGTKDVAIVVEDCASACAVSSLMTGLALLGTDFSVEYLNILKRYKHVILALDKDALRKTLEIEASIRFFAEVSILFLEEDLKVLDEKHLKEFLGEHYNLSDIGELE